MTGPHYNLLQRGGVRSASSSDKTLIAVVHQPHRLYKQLKEPSDDGEFTHTHTHTLC